MSKIIRTTVRDADVPVSALRDFTAGAMSGERGAGGYGTGYLPREWVGTFRRDVADGQAYVVYSYSTPIAWVRSDGLRVVPPVTYSVTTSRHQSRARSGLGVRWGKTYAHPARSMADL